MLEVADRQHNHAQIPATPHETLGIEHQKKMKGLVYRENTINTIQASSFPGSLRKGDAGKTHPLEDSSGEKGTPNQSC